tara:strand:- start:6979 stop:7593 length:615 start_codon:yes stop_codon:yes gene_type:complete
MKKIGIINTGISNFGSIENVLLRFGYEGVNISNANQIKNYKKIIIPGVGKFDTAMEYLNNNNISNVLVEYINQTEVYVLGICLGMHLLCRRSEEGILPGLNILNSDVVHLKNLIKKNQTYPHMGWNELIISRNNKILPIGSKYRFYFVHNYCLVPDDPDIEIARCSYGEEFCVAIQQKNVFGVQFHPERSHKFGLGLIQRFLLL